MSAQEPLVPGSVEWQALEALALANVDLSAIGDGMRSWQAATTRAIAALQMSYALARSKATSR